MNVTLVEAGFGQNRLRLSGTSYLTIISKCLQKEIWLEAWP
jgi:hypothetical protein